jgi:hypothetical protein
MSFIITIHVQEGIVMASDSRLTLNRLDQIGEQKIQVSVPQSDANYKTFLTPGGVGISTFGDADIERVPISGYIESFIHEKLPSKNIDPKTVPKLLMDHFSALPKIPNTFFHVAAYASENEKRMPYVWLIDLSQQKISQLNPPGQQGASWGGESDVISRLLLSVGTMDSQGKFNQMPTVPIDWQFFTLQDAIDFAIYAVKTTIDTMRFQTRVKTVGGPIDVLVIKPECAFWVLRKELHAKGIELSF